MKKIIMLALATIAIFTLSACSNGDSPQTGNASPASSPSSTAQVAELATADVSDGGNSNILVAYFSMPETLDPNSMTQDEDNSVVIIDGEVLGNTQYVAMLIEENTGGDIYRIEPATAYPTDHNALVDLADKEQSENARPELLTSIANPEAYDVVFLGYPIWWGDMPMVLYTFLEGHDLSGKTIIPFNTHGGSGFSNTIQTIAELQPNATVITNGFSVSRNDVDSSENDIIAWLQSLNLEK